MKLHNLVESLEKKYSPNEKLTESLNEKLIESAKLDEGGGSDLKYVIELLADKYDVSYSIKKLMNIGASFDSRGFPIIINGMKATIVETPKFERRDINGTMKSVLIGREYRLVINRKSTKPVLWGIDESDEFPSDDFYYSVDELLGNVSVTEDLDQTAQWDFNSDVYNALTNIGFKWRNKELSKSDWEKALEWFELHFFDEFDDMEENLNESYVDEWWGQTEEDPHDLEQYGLKVDKLKQKGDETLYRFSGSKDAILKAKNDGYFYSLDYNEDDGHSEDLREGQKLNENPLLAAAGRAIATHAVDKAFDKLNEDLEDDIYQKLFQSVETIIDGAIDNLAVVMASEVEVYNPDWCAEIPSSEIVHAKDKFIEVLVEDLMENYSE